MRVTRARSWFVRRLLAVFVASVVLLTGTEAWAAFDSSGSAGHSVSTAVLAPPSSPAASTTTCNTLVLTATATVTWTATTSTWADGYEVLTSSISGGPYTVAATVSGASSTSAQISALSLGTTTYVVVRATKQAWRSPSTAQITYKAPLACL